MLRDRVPLVVDMALKWQKAKDAWVDHAYRYFIKLVGDEKNINGNIVKTSLQNKKDIARIILGIKNGKPIGFDFHKSIDWENLSDEETTYWKRVESWVEWFRQYCQYIQNAWQISKDMGKDDFDIKVEIINTYLKAFLPSPDDEEEYKEAKYRYVDKLADYLIKCFETRW